MRLILPAAMLAVLAAMLAACAPVNPGPSPGPATIFTRGTFDCDLPVVEEQAAGATQDVVDCLVSTRTRECLPTLVPAVAPETVACCVRALGMATAIKRAEGTATDLDVIVAKSAKAWILAEWVGYR